MRIRRIQSTLVRAFSLIVALTIVLLGAVSMYFLRTALVEAAEQSTMLFASQLSRIVDDYISYMDDISLVVAGDADVRAYMASPGSVDREYRARIARFLGSIRGVRKDIDSVFLIPLGPGGADGARAIAPENVLASSPGMRVNPDYDFSRFPRPVGGFSLSSAHVENMIDGRYPWVVSLTREERGERGELLGYVQVDLNYAIIDDLCRAARPSSSGYVFIISPDGNLVYHPRQQLIYGELKTERIGELLAMKSGFLDARVDGRRLIYTATPSSKTGWVVVAVSYLSELLEGTRRALLGFGSLAALCFAVAAAVAAIISVRISRPIESLRRLMQEVEKGNFDMDITVECENEVYQLALDCDIAVKKVRDLIEQNRKDAEQKRILELRALQGQINPHFLYNTLDSIIWMIELGEHEGAIDVTSSLARFFRLGLSRGSEIIPISAEEEYLETYLSIQRVRYKDKLDYAIDFDPGIRGFRILKLLVQPLVENAIYHGIKNKESPGTVRVSGRRDGDDVVIRVEDDGVGMDGLKLGELERILRDAPRLSSGEPFDGPSSRGGVGIRNVQERIMLYFGPKYGLSFESGLGEGSVASIRIPVMSGTVS